jgi:histidine kinase-like protein
MNLLAPTRSTEPRNRHIRLTAGPAAPAQARAHVKAAIRAWEIPVDLDTTVLLTSELVTNAIRQPAGGTVTLAITCCCCEFRVDVHDASRSLPVLVDAPADAEAGRGLMLVTMLSTDWGAYRTPAGKAVYFTLAFGSHPAARAGDPPCRSSALPTVSGESSPQRSVPAEGG